MPWEIKLWGFALRHFNSSYNRHSREREKERKSVKLFWNYCDTYRRRIYLSLLIPLMAIASFLPEGWMEFKYKYYIAIQNDLSVKKWVRWNWTTKITQKIKDSQLQLKTILFWKLSTMLILQIKDCPVQVIIFLIWPLNWGSEKTYRPSGLFKDTSKRCAYGSTHAVMRQKAKDADKDTRDIREWL